MPGGELEDLHGELISEEDAKRGGEKEHAQPGCLLSLIFAEFIGPDWPKNAYENLEEASEEPANQ